MSTTTRRRARRMILVGGSAFIAFSFWLSFVRPAQLKAQYARNNLTCAARMETLGQALIDSAGRNGGTFPGSTNDVVGSGGVTAQTLICPCTHTLGAVGTTPYVYLPGHQPDHAERAELILLFEPNGQRVCFVDGSVRFLQKHELDAALDRTKLILADRNPNVREPGAAAP